VVTACRTSSTVKSEDKAKMNLTKNIAEDSNKQACSRTV
jgi:hypothetical protein